MKVAGAAVAADEEQKLFIYQIFTSFDRRWSAQQAVFGFW